MDDQGLDCNLRVGFHETGIVFYVGDDNGDPAGCWTSSHPLADIEDLLKKLRAASLAQEEVPRRGRQGWKPRLTDCV